MKKRMFNLRTKELEWVEPDEQTDMRDYIPQDENTQMLYQMYLQLGMSPLKAGLQVLIVVTGFQAEKEE